MSPTLAKAKAKEPRKWRAEDIFPEPGTSATRSIPPSDPGAAQRAIEACARRLQKDTVGRSTETPRFWTWLALSLAMSLESSNTLGDPSSSTETTTSRDAMCVTHNHGSADRAQESAHATSSDTDTESWDSSNPHPRREHACVYDSSCYSLENSTGPAECAVSHADLGEDCRLYRKQSVRGAQQRQTLCDGRILSLSYIFFAVGYRAMCALHIAEQSCNRQELQAERKPAARKERPLA
ncbi:hypothetical protein BCR43DRAFT_278971 [Syncephalastrum racemosum]|uniref:Uncharacterized protein n=1 Tax=Syncephalastrum racemosum TaxID=13706 RepID=A0A1X2HCM5_SYNRA|nr:hypothetical protein BCR43DRAFT_278971 [Syncephalastrum racemosum]